MGAMKQMHQAISEAGMTPHIIEYAVVEDGVVRDTYEDLEEARMDARILAWTAAEVTGETDVSVEVVPFMQFEPEVFAGESSGIQ